MPYNSYSRPSWTGWTQNKTDPVQRIPEYGQRQWGQPQGGQSQTQPWGQPQQGQPNQGYPRPAWPTPAPRPATQNPSMALQRPWMAEGWQRPDSGWGQPPQAPNQWGGAVGQGQYPMGGGGISIPQMGNPYFPGGPGTPQRYIHDPYQEWIRRRNTFNPFMPIGG